MAQHSQSELHAGLKTTTASKDYGCCEDVLFFGRLYQRDQLLWGVHICIHAMMNVQLSHEPSSQYDRNAVLVSFCGTIVGHLVFETEILYH